LYILQVYLLQGLIVESLLVELELLQAPFDLHLTPFSHIHKKVSPDSAKELLAQSDIVTILDAHLLGHLENCTLCYSLPDDHVCHITMITIVATTSRNTLTTTHAKFGNLAGCRAAQGARLLNNEVRHATSAHEASES
jgi:hypothetical protein